MKIVTKVWECDMVLLRDYLGNLDPNTLVSELTNEARGGALGEFFGDPGPYRDAPKGDS